MKRILLTTLLCSIAFAGTACTFKAEKKKTVSSSPGNPTPPPDNSRSPGSDGQDQMQVRNLIGTDYVKEVGRMDDLSTFARYTEYYNFAKQQRTMSDFSANEFATFLQSKNVSFFVVYKFAYKFASVTRGMSNDFSRNEFADEWAKNGNIDEFFTYADKYVFAKQVRGMRGDFSCNEFGRHRQVRFNHGYREAYVMGTSLRGFTNDFTRNEWAEKISFHPYSVDFLKTYKSAYEFARDVRRMSSDFSLNEFAMNAAIAAHGRF